MKKRGLGKGLEALLGNVEQDGVRGIDKNNNFITLDINRLSVNTFQPRKHFDDNSLKELSDSIKTHGIIQPIAVRKIKDDYEIIAGERRFRAAKLADLTEVPVIIHSVSDKESATFALIENLQREDLNVIDKAKGIKRLISDFSLTHQQCSKILGQSRSAVSNTLRLLELDDSVQDSLQNKKIDMGHARALLSLDKATQNNLLKKIELTGLSVREVESLVKHSSEQNTKQVKIKKTKEVLDLETSLSNYFNAKTKVVIGKDSSGKISILFKSGKSLQEILDKIDLC